MTAQIYAIIVAAAMFFGLLAAAFAAGVKYEDNKLKAEHADDIQKMLKAVGNARSAVDSGKLPLEYRD